MPISSGSYAFITKDSSLSAPRSVNNNQFNSLFDYGQIITASLPLSASIKSDYWLNGQNRPRIRALRNTIEFYSYLSKQYQYSSSFSDKSNIPIRLISIPSLMYGQEIRKGSISCRFYYTGSLIGELRDYKQNGELIQVGPTGSTGSGSIAGIALYSEGFILLTGSWSLHSTYTDIFNIYTPSTNVSPSWLYYMMTGSGEGTGQANTNTVPSSSFTLDFEGTERIPTITLFTHAEKGEFNFSNNPTFIEYGQVLTPYTSSTSFKERSNIKATNISDVKYNQEPAFLEKTTYISQVGIYDKDKNLIAVAKLSSPVKKRISDDIGIKIKLDG